VIEAQTRQTTIGGFGQKEHGITTRFIALAATLSLIGESWPKKLRP
jgi:hypothetical protein